MSRLQARGMFVIVCGSMLGYGSFAALPAQATRQEPNASTAPVSKAPEANSRNDEKPDSPKAKLDAVPSQPSNSAISVERSSSGSSEDNLAVKFFRDQEAIWTSPAKLRLSDANWVIPIGGIGAGLFATDAEFSRHLSNDPKTISRYKSVSNAGIGALVGSAGGMWLLGHARHDDHWTETGFLSGEAALNSLVAVEALKYSLRRERPFQLDGTGQFFQSGGTSFPSEHAAAAWSVAGVIAHEYPGPLTKLAAYGLASLVTLSRVKARQHFPSDVMVGSLIGNLVAQDIYNRRHDPELGGEAWRSASQFLKEASRSTENHGSPYVPLDSWVYQTFDRLAAMGLVDSAFSGMRPWTRRECARLAMEADDALDASNGGEPSKLVETLTQEFQPEINDANGSLNVGFRLESIYSRTEHISGEPLNDGYHFAQTQFNDFGRPYGQGWNSINGFSAYSTAGPWVLYLRGESQSAPAIPAYSLPVRQTIQAIDFLPQTPPGTPQPAINRFSLLDAYVGFTFSDWQISFGKQSLLWAPGEAGSLMLSENPPPMNMIRINRTSPTRLPSFLHWLGPVRAEFFLAQMSGFHFENTSNGFVGNFLQQLSPQPLIHGEKVNFKPTPNFEFGLSRTVIFGGIGHPFTLGTLLRTYFPELSGHSANVGQPDYSGDQQSELDWSYRLPRLRRWLTFYGDAFADDEISPIAYWDRSAIHAGLFLSHVPGVPKLDLRVEGLYTDNPPGPSGGFTLPGFFYFSTLVPEGQTNNGYLLSNWIGRQGQGAQAWTNYWWSSRSRLQLNFRHQKVSQQFIPGGGTLTDVGVRGDYWVRSDLGVSISIQGEQWLFPLIRPGPSRNVSASVQIQFQPTKLFRRPENDGGGRP